MDPRINIYKAAVSHQTGRVLLFRCIKAAPNLDNNLTSSCFKAVAIMEEVLEMCFGGVWRFFRLVAMKGAKRYLMLMARRSSNMVPR